MAEFDIKKSAEAIAEWLANYFEQFIFLLTRPRAAVEAQFAPTVTRTQRMQNALIYAAGSILLGICFAKFIGLSKSPAEVNPQTALAVLIIWMLSAAVLHPFLKLFRGKGVIQDTIVVFLLVISTVHLLFIPILAVASHFLTDTKVTLSYEYVIYFGPELNTWGGHREGINATENWRDHLKGEHTEEFIKEKDPQRNKTILPPVQDASTYASPSDVPQNPEVRTRVSPTGINLPAPLRREVPELRDGVGWFLLGLWLVYYLTNSAYLAAGLAVPHQKSPYSLFSLSLIGPLSVGILTLTILAVITLIALRNRL